MPAQYIAASFVCARRMTGRSFFKQSLHLLAFNILLDYKKFNFS